MGVKSILFLSLFVLAVLAAPAAPLWGVLGYLGHYYVWPEAQWWGRFLAQMDVRVSLTIAALTAVGVLLNWGRIRARTPGPLFHSQEWLLWLYAGVIGLTEVWALPENPDFPTPGEPPFFKMMKVAAFVFLLTHVATTKRDLKRLLWFMLLVGGGYLGYQALTAPAATFSKSRLDKLGGPDFAESSFLAAHFALMGVLAATCLLGSREWWRKLLSLLIGGLVLNGLVLTRTRAAYVAVLAGLVAAPLLADRKLRKPILSLMALGWLAAPFVIDEGFWERMTTITTNEQEMEHSAFSRWQLWGAAVQMWGDHPFGVGAGNFFGAIGHYLPEYAGRDTHNTYLRCLAEVGLPGLLVLGLLVVNAFRTLRWCKRTARNELAADDLTAIAWGLQVMLVVFLVAGLFMSMTYMEELFLLLALPACLHRAVWNELEEQNDIDPDAEREDVGDE